MGAGVREGNGKARWGRARGLLPSLLVVALYAPSLGFDFVWDDLALVRLPVYANFDLGRVLSTPANGAEYLPVRDLSLMLDHALYGEAPAGFHATNVALFAVAAWLVLALYRRLLAAHADERVRRTAAMLALVCAGAFVAHPLQVEPVAFVTGRNALLALCLVLGSALAYTRHLQHPGGLAWAASLVLCGLAIFAKQTALPLPFVLLFLHLGVRRDSGLRDAVGSVAPHFALVFAVAGLHLAVAQHAATLHDPSLAAGLVARLSRALVIPQFYLWKVVWPVPLGTHYEFPALRVHVVPWIVSTLVLGSLALAVLRQGWQARSFSGLCLASAGVLLVPVLKIVPTSPLLADRYMQLPLIFVLPLLLVPLAARLPARAAAAGGLVLVATLSLVTSRQLPVWASDVTLFEHAVEVNPRSLLALGNLGVVYWNAGREDDALDVLAARAERVPDDLLYDYFRGMKAQSDEDLAAAADFFFAATQKQGSIRHLAFLHLGEVYEARGELARAVAAYRQAADIAAVQGEPPDHVRTIEGRLRRAMKAEARGDRRR